MLVAAVEEFLVVAAVCALFLWHLRSALVAIIALPLGVMAAFLISLPNTLYQVWAFIAPGLYDHEKKLAVPLVMASMILLRIISTEE